MRDTVGRSRAGRRLVLAAVAATLAAIAAACAPRNDFPDWAFPASNTATPAGGWDAKAAVGLTGSDRHFTQAQLHDLSTAVDWRPDSHPPAPPIVLTGAKGVSACGFCHLPGGEGRPENASLAGLPAGYIKAQVAAMRAGARRGAKPDWGPTALMTQVADLAGDADVAAAADYFSSLSFRSHVRVVETAAIGRPVAKGFLLMAGPGPKEPIGQRIVETPASFENFERRDATLTYTAYVPMGSLARGRALAESGGPSKTPCASCHGVGLRGGEGIPGPPLAGRSPSYLFRQLYAFRHQGRRGGTAETMRQETAGLEQSDMVALAAYVASLKP